MSKGYYSYIKSMQKKTQLRISDSISWNPCASTFDWVPALDEFSKLTWVLIYSEFWNYLKLKSSFLFMKKCSFAKLSFQFSVWNGNKLPPDSFPHWVQGYWQFITEQWGALYVEHTWACPWVVSQMIISGFAGAFLHLERNEIDIYRVLFFVLYSKGKKWESKCSGILCCLFIMIAEILSWVVCRIVTFVYSNAKIY